jgi:hypothetical protein
VFIPGIGIVVLLASEVGLVLNQSISINPNLVELIQR